MAARIYYLCSYSRSGETLFLRQLSAHPDVEAAYNLYVKDNKSSRTLMQECRARLVNTFDADECAQYNITTPVVLAKQIWNHWDSTNGIILVRNPISICASILPNLRTAAAQARGIDRLSRVAGYIDEGLSQYFDTPDCDLSFAVHIAASWTMRMRHLHATDSQSCIMNDSWLFLKYLGPVMNHMGVPQSNKVFEANKEYPAGLIRHGGIKMDSPIHQTSLLKY